MHVLGLGIDLTLYGRFLNCMHKIWSGVLQKSYMNGASMSSFMLCV